MTARVLAFILAGGAGRHLRPLTRYQATSALPFGARQRLIDFVLSNLLHSEIRNNYLLVRHRPEALQAHIRSHWTGIGGRRGFHVVVPPRQRHDTNRPGPGAAEALGHQLHLIEHHRPDVVAVLSADQVCRMDVRQMVDFHLAQDAAATVATLPDGPVDGHDLGAVACDVTGRVVQMADRLADLGAGEVARQSALGMYLFRPDTVLNQMRNLQPGSDLRRDILPRLAETGRVMAYDFGTNRVPGVQCHEERPYWRGLGSLHGYFQAHMDLLGMQPRFEPSNPFWPVGQVEPMGHAQSSCEDISNSLVGAAGSIGRARLERCVVRNQVHIEDDAELDQCVVHDGAIIGRGARLRGVIVGPNQTIRPGTVIDAWQGRGRAPIVVYEPDSSGISRMKRLGAGDRRKIPMPVSASG